MLNKQQALNKRGIISDGEIKSLVREWRNSSLEEELNHATIETEMKATEKKISQSKGWLCKLGHARNRNSSNRMAYP